MRSYSDALDAAPRPSPAYRDVEARERAGETGGLSHRGGNVLGLCVCDGPYGPDDATRCVTCGGEL